MEYFDTVTLKDNRTLIIRNGFKEDAEELLSFFISTRGETDLLLTYPEECRFTVGDEEKFLEAVRKAEKSALLLAILDGKVVGSAGLDPKGRGMKSAHRSDYGIAVSKEYWGLGIGRSLTLAALECAKRASYTQVELEVVEYNAPARSLYSSLGWKECGTIPRAYITKEGKIQNTVMMVKFL